MFIEYILSANDSELIKKEIKKSTPFILVNPFLAFIILIAEILLILGFSFDGFKIWEIIYVIVFPIINIFLAFILPKLLEKIPFVKKLFAIDPSQTTKGEVLFNSQGIKATIGTTTYDFKWFYFTKIIERDSFFYFYYQPLQSLNIPKRAFSSEQIEKLHQIITNNIDAKKVKIRLKDKGDQ